MIDMVVVVVVTCWLIYRRDCTNKRLAQNAHMRLFAFKSEIAHSLCRWQKKWWDAESMQKFKFG